MLAKSRRVDVADLPGTPTELLSTPIPGGLTVRPLYTRLDETPEPGLPGEFPFVRGADRARDVVLGWRVTERFADDDTAASAVNEQILDACANGTSGLWLRVGEGIDADGLGAALAGVYLDLLPVTLDVGADVAALADVDPNATGFSPFGKSQSGITNRGGTGTGATAIQPNGSSYYAPAGAHQAWLSGPAGSDFDLELYRFNGSSWTKVAQGIGPTSSEQVSYTGQAGWYFWYVVSYSGSGRYDLWLRVPR